MKLQEIIRNNYKFAGIAAASFLIDEGMKNYVEAFCSAAPRTGSLRYCRL